MSGSAAARRPAAFLDRDGTLIRDAHFLRDATQVELLPGVTAALRSLRNAGYALVVVTNQSGIARGMLREEDYAATRIRLDELLADAGVRLDASYHCPHHPDVSGPCDCRKPGTGMHRQAAQELNLDLANSLYLGDRWRDVAPALELGGRGILVPGPDTPDDDCLRAQADAQLASSLADALALVGLAVDE